MNKVLKKEVPPIVVILVFFLISAFGMIGYSYSTKQRLLQRQQYLDVAIREALVKGVNKDSLKSKFAKSDTLK